MSDKAEDEGGTLGIASGIVCWLIGFMIMYHGIGMQPFIPKGWAAGASLALVALSFYSPLLKRATVAWLPQMLAGAIMAVAIV